MWVYIAWKSLDTKKWKWLRGHTEFFTTKWQMYFVNFSPLKCDKNHCFDNFVYKTFAQFILHTFWCILMHIDAFFLLRAKYAIFTRKIVNFAYFYKIKTTSLIISCIKHLHISFCTHFEAFSCKLIHSEHLEQNVENNIFFF